MKATASKTTHRRRHHDAAPPTREATGRHAARVQRDVRR
jgi:hypothetical protein